MDFNLLEASYGKQHKSIWICIASALTPNTAEKSQGLSQFNYRPLYWTASPAFTSAAGRFVVVTRPTELDAAEAERLVWEPTLPRYDFHDMM